MLSVIGQSFTDIELVIVDDGSADGTADIVERFRAKDRRVRSLRKANSGIADSLNQGIELARGHWICRLDADDIAMSDRIEKQLSLAAAHPSAALVGGDLVTINSEGNAVRRYRYPTTHDQLVKQLVNGGRFFAHSTTMFRRDLALAVGGYRPRISRAEDHDLWMRLADVGTLHGVGTEVVRYRLHDEQTSYHDGGIRQALDKLVAVCSYHLRHLGEPDPVEGSEAEFAAFRALVEQRAEAFRHFDLISLRVGLAKNRRTVGTNAVLSGLLRTGLSDPDLLLRLILLMFGANRISDKIARDWICQRQRILAELERQKSDPIANKKRELMW